MHLSTRLLNHLWVAEVRTPQADGSSTPFAAVEAGDSLLLPHGLEAQLLRPHRYPSLGRKPEQSSTALHSSQRLWLV